MDGLSQAAQTSMKALTTPWTYDYLKVDISGHTGAIPYLIAASVTSTPINGHTYHAGEHIEIMLGTSVPVAPRRRPWSTRFRSGSETEGSTIVAPDWSGRISYTTDIGGCWLFTRSTSGRYGHRWHHAGTTHWYGTTDSPIWTNASDAAVTNLQQPGLRHRGHRPGAPRGWVPGMGLRAAALCSIGVRAGQLRFQIGVFNQWRVDFQQVFPLPGRGNTFSSP